jgi:hypothetical protein
VAQTVDYEIIGSYNNQRVTSIDAERSVNLFEYLDPLGKKNKVLLPTAGLVNTNILFLNAANGFRAQFVFKGFIYSVIGADIYRSDASLTTTQLTTSTNKLSNVTGYVGIDANNFQIIFVSGNEGLIYDTNTNVLVKITDPAFPSNPIDVCYLDGFFVVANGGTNSFQLSSFNNGLIWGLGSDTFAMAASSANIILVSGAFASFPIGSPVQFSGGTLPAELVAGTTYYVISHVGTDTITVSATPGGAAIVSIAGGSGAITNNGQLQQGSITSHPGNIVACRTLHRRLFLFSEYYTEIWENNGIGTNLPFRRINSQLMEFGTTGRASIVTGFDKMFFLSQTRDGLGSVMEVMGSQAIPISGRALDFQLAQYAATVGVADAQGIIIKENGLIFYRLNFTAANHTYVYNDSMSDEQDKRWHEEEILNGNRHPAQTHAYFNGKNYFGNYQSPIMYLVDSSISTNDMESIRRMRIGRAICPPGYQRLRVDRFQVDLLQGQLPDNAMNLSPLNLLAETGDTLLTESGDDIILEQTLETFDDTIIPVVFLSISKDGGQTYGNRIASPMGAVGERTFRTLWRKSGTTKRGQAFVPKIEFFNQTPFVLLGASWAFEILPE